MYALFVEMYKMAQENAIFASVRYRLATMQCRFQGKHSCQKAYHRKK